MLALSANPIADAIFPSRERSLYSIAELRRLRSELGSWVQRRYFNIREVGTTHLTIQFSCPGYEKKAVDFRLHRLPELTNAAIVTLLLRLASRERACTVVLFVRAVHHWYRPNWHDSLCSTPRHAK